MLDTFSYFLHIMLILNLTWPHYLSFWREINYLQYEFKFIPDQKVGYLVKSRLNSVIYRKSDWKYLIWCKMMNFAGGVNFLLLLTISQLNQSLIIKGHFSHFESWHIKFAHLKFDYDKLHWIQHSFNLGIIIIIFSV